MTNDDDFTTPTEGSPTWIAELRRRCPTPEETDALCDMAERLADIERDVRGLMDDMGRWNMTGIEVQDEVEERLRAILDPPEGGCNE